MIRLVVIALVMALVPTASVVSEGNGEILGTDGRLIQVSIEVEPGLELVEPAPDVAVFNILSDYRSWIGGGDVRFQIVDTADADVRIRIAPPAVVDARCRPLRTGGRLSCRNGRSLNINADRWNGATEFWTAGLDVYRAYLINHELGHFLGYGHVGCPGAGQRAPVMQQQTKSLQGCVENGWPYPDNPPVLPPVPELNLGEGSRASRVATEVGQLVRRVIKIGRSPR